MTVSALQIPCSDVISNLAVDEVIHTRVPPVVREHLEAAERERLRAEIKQLLAGHNAVLVLRRWA